MGERFVIAALFVAVIVFRFAVASSFQAPAADGLQYYRLAQTLRLSQQFAYEPGEPPTFSRLPGYPLFLAFVARIEAPSSVTEHLRAATRANVILDVGSAGLVALLLRGLGLGALAMGLGALLSLLAPLQVVLASYGLSESLATFLTTLELFLLLAAFRGRKVLCFALAGGVAGLFQLTRVDAVTTLPAVGLAAFLIERRLAPTFKLLSVFALVALLFYAPWPLRNWLRFGHPHFEGVEWVAKDGKPFPTGFMKWALTWSSGAPGEAYDFSAVASREPLDVRRQGILLPTMYDSDAERAQVVAVFEAYNRDGLSDSVDHQFRALARERSRRAPVRTYFWLPLQRSVALWEPLPQYELSIKVPWLRMPEKHDYYFRTQAGLMILALFGCVVLWRKGAGPGRHALLLVGAAVFARTVLSFAHPCPTQRYLAEVFPLIMMLSAVAGAGLLTRLRPRQL